jgi:dipeptide transport system permease protein
VRQLFLWPLQFFAFLRDLLRGDLGDSTMSGRPVASDLITFLPAMALASGVIILRIGFPLGVLAALKRGSRMDNIASTPSLVFIAIPVFWFGLLLQLERSSLLVK